MSLPPHIFTPAMRQQRLGWFFAVLVGIMVYLATFAMAAEATLSALTFTWDSGMERRLTVEIPAVAPEADMPQAERKKLVLSILHAMPDVTRVEPLSDDDTARLLSPWLTDEKLVKSLPVPILIDLDRTDVSALSAEDVQDRLRTVVKDVRVEDQAAWLGDVRNLIHGLAGFGGMMIVLTGLTLVIAVNLICRAIMSAEHDTIALLHIMGAEDEALAGLFQAHTLRLSAPAAVVGFVLALSSAAMLFFAMRHVADLSLLRFYHWVGLGFLALSIPLGAVYVAAWSARFSVRGLLLRSMP